MNKLEQNTVATIHDAILVQIHIDIQIPVNYLLL